MMRSDPGEAWSSGRVVDLTLTAPASGPSPEPPVVPITDPEMSALRRRRRIALALVALCAAVVATDIVVGKIVHDQRQRHLAAEMAEPIEKVPVGGAAMVLQIPSIGLNRVVIEGSAAPQLRSGPGRLVSSADPASDEGVTVIVGRRRRYGGPFALLNEVSKGDLVAIKTRSQIVRRFVVSEVRRTDAPVSLDADTRLALITSASGRFDRRFLVIEATAEAESTAATADPTPDQQPSPAAAEQATAPDRSAKSAAALSREQLDARPSARAGLLGLVGLVGLIGAGVTYWRWSEQRYGAGVRVLGIGVLASTGAICLMFLVDLVLPATG